MGWPVWSVAYFAFSGYTTSRLSTRPLGSARRAEPPRSNVNVAGGSLRAPTERSHVAGSAQRCDGALHQRFGIKRIP